MRDDPAEEKDKREEERFFEEEAEPTASEEESSGFSEDTRKPEKQRRRRPIWVAAVVILICLYFVVAMWQDLMFFFTRSEPVPLGEVIGFEGTELPDNSYVSVSGIRNPAKGIYLPGWFYDQNIFQLMGTRLIFVETAKKDDNTTDGLREEIFTGRLLRFGNVSYFQAVRDFAAFNFGIDIPKEALIVRTFQKPEDMWHVPLYMAFLLFIIGVNLYLLVRPLLHKEE